MQADSGERLAVGETHLTNTDGSFAGAMRQRRQAG